MLLSLFLCVFNIVFVCIVVSFTLQDKLFEGVPFLFGVIPVLLAILVACCIKEKTKEEQERHTSSKAAADTNYYCR